MGRHNITAGILILAATALLIGCGGARETNPSGTLEATEVDVAATLAGRVRDVRAKLGDAVRANDTLVVLDTELLALQRAQTEAGRASLQAQRKAAGDALSQARENLSLLETTLSRLNTLHEQGSVTAQQLDEAQTKRDVAAMQVSAGRHHVDALAAEETKLEAALAVFDRQLRDGVILSPVSGTVILRNIEPGEVAAPGAALLRMADLTMLELRVYLGEGELDRVKIGRTIPVIADALPNDTLQGTVTWVSSEAEFTPKNAQTRDARAQLVYAVKVHVANADGALHIGMPAEIIL